MLGAAVLDAARFPHATFEITAIAPLEEKSERGLPQYQLDGKFTLHGAVQPIRIIVDIDEKDGWLHLRGGFNIRQTQYGIRPFSKALGTIGVTDQLTIWGDLWLAKGRASLRQ
jgi:polyisoprenoid-binding protein YceI